VVGGGDPGLCDARLAQVIGQPQDFVFDSWCGILSQCGVQAVGTVVLDDSIFDQQLIHPDWPADQMLSWYQAPVAGLNLNDNCLDVTVQTARAGLSITSMPRLPDTLLVNQLRSGRKQDAHISRAADSDVFELRGSIGHTDQLGPITVRRPAVIFGAALREALAAHGIACAGRIVRRNYEGRLPEGARLLHVHRTSLRDVLWRCNTFSQNFFAECLAKALVAYRPDGLRSGIAGNWNDGLHVERGVLERMGIDLRDCDLHDGSGLSHDNRVTCRVLADLLRTMMHHREGRAFLDSLAVAGRDGTLRRYNTPQLANRLRGKTGTLNNVHGIAAVLDRQDNAPLIIVVLANGTGSSGLPRSVSDIIAGCEP
jgi:D-alanyl-D-alanine carboxypeptidase/D-alanyl-D-alanine-endopeptidase (penicillin-binding protein 4)